MNSNSRDDSATQNLVMFPSAKNYRVNLTNVDLGPDPLNELLHEYSHLKVEDLDYEFAEFPDKDDPRFEDFNIEDESENEDSFDSLDAFMNRHQRKDNLTPDDKLVMAVNQRIEAIRDAKDRIKFYLDEIEMFLPSKKR